MSTDTTDADNDLRERITNFLRRNFPQIQMHGGSAAISHLDRESGEVTVQLGGACSGCGISPMTIQAIKSRMVKEIPEIETVHADTGARAGADATSAAPAAAACHPPSPARRPTTAATTKAPRPRSERFSRSRGFVLSRFPHSDSYSLVSSVSDASLVDSVWAWLSPVARV